ncbi:endo-1,4-beta-xylanase B-like [Brassica napus]|nr:endo-1,4-beta-xylanase B-like [Brassica napus]
MGSWSHHPPPMGSWATDPPFFESLSPCSPYSGSSQLGPASLGSWPPCPPPLENWLHDAPPPSSMPSGSSSGPPCHDFMPSGCPLGSGPLIRPPETIQPAPKLDEKAKPLTKPGSNDKTKPYDSEEVKSSSKSGDSSNSGKQPANTDPPKQTLNQDDKAKPLTKHGSNDGTKRDTFDEVKPPTKSRDNSSLGTPLANTGPLNHVQKPDVQENLSTTPGENVKTEYPAKHGVSFELKPPTTLGDSSNSGTSPTSTNPLEPEPNLEDKGKPSIKHGGNDETKSPIKGDGFNEVKPITKPGGSSTSGMPAANIGIPKVVSKPNDSEKNSAEVGGNDETKLGGSDEVKPPTKTGGYGNSGMLPTNTYPSKLAPKPYDKEKSLTILDGTDKTKSSTMHGGSNELKPPTNLGSKNETKPPTKLGGSDETKPLHWFLIRKSTQGKQ